MTPSQNPSAQKGKSSERPNNHQQGLGTKDQSIFSDFTTLLDTNTDDGEDEALDNDDEPVQLKFSVSSPPPYMKGPISPADPAWNDNATEKAWRYCPSDIPELWKQWWYRPVCGGPQSRLRYAIAKSKWLNNTGPLPYETLKEYKDRSSDGRSKRLTPKAADIWEEFQSRYQPWAPVDGDMWDASATPFSKEDNELMQDLYEKGLQSTYIHEYFPQYLKEECRIQYLVMVADNFGKRSEGAHEEYSAWDRDWRATHPDIEKKKKWTGDEEKVAMALFSYGLTTFACAEEFQVRTSAACRAKKRALGVERAMAIVAEAAGDHTVSSSSSFQISGYNHVMATAKSQESGQRHNIPQPPVPGAEQAIAAARGPRPSEAVESTRSGPPLPQIAPAPNLSATLRTQPQISQPGVQQRAPQSALGGSQSGSQSGAQHHAQNLAESTSRGSSSTTRRRNPAPALSRDSVTKRRRQ
jgi:hypothetical protein